MQSLLNFLIYFSTIMWTLNKYLNFDGMSKTITLVVKK